MVFLGLLLVFVFEYIRPQTWVPILGTVGTVVALSVFALSLMSKSDNSNADVLNDRNGKLMLFFLSLVIISVLTAHVTEFAFNRFKAVLGYFFLFFMLAKLATDLKRLRLLFALLVIIHVVLLILNPNVVLDTTTRSYLDNSGFLSDGNDFALSACIAFPMGIFLFLEARSTWVKVLYVISLGILLLGVVGSQSRGAALGMSAILLYQWIRSRKKMRGVLVGVLILATILMYAPSAYFERLETIKDYEGESSAELRLIIWSSAIRMANDHPILGVGAGHFSTMFGTQYRPPGETASSLPWQNAHSIYFMLLGELGYPGLLFLLILFFSNWGANHRRILEVGRLPGAVAETQRRLLVCNDSSLIAFAVAGAFLSGIYYPHVFVLAGLSAAIALQYRRAIANIAEPDAQHAAMPTDEVALDAPAQDRKGGPDKH